MAATKPAKAPQNQPASVSPELEKAAKALAEGQLDIASDGFEVAAQSTSARPFVCGLSMLGLAQVALARQDAGAAVAAWERMAGDSTLPRFFRDTAGRRISQTERLRQGLAGRDPAAYRARLPVLPEPAVVFHVAPDGDDKADGSQAKPFRTFEKARDAVRELKNSHSGALPKGGVRIMIEGGSYFVDHTLNLSAQDSGTSEAPVVYQAAPGDTPVLRGGIRITGWKPISDAKSHLGLPAELCEKLDPSVGKRVLEVNLKNLGVTDLGDATALRRRPELFVDGAPQTLARWPNEGFVKTGEVLGKETFKVWNTIEGCKDGKFRYLEDRPSRWLDEPDVRLYGYWFWDWFEEYQKVASIDADARTFTLSAPYSNYGFREGQRYYAVNVFREFDCPGEWYLDRGAAMLYWLPADGINVSKAEAVLSVFDQPFVVLDDVENVILLGLTLQEARGDAIHIRGGAECLVAGCTIRQIGGDAIVVQGGNHHGIFGCTMNTLGCGGARVAGGDRQQLTAGNHFVENCTVFDISRIKRTYTPAVHLDGCGNRIAHNLFERMPSSAMRIEGNDHLIELNLIRNVVQESDDQGGVDMFGNPLYRGVVIRWNRWSDIRGGTHNGTAGVRLDDMISGVAVHGNVFERCGAVIFGGVQIHGGKENLVDGNLFIDCHAGISFSRWGEKRWLDSVERFHKQAGEPPYSTRYPELAGLRADADINFISRNLFARCGSVFLRDGGVELPALNAATGRVFEPQAASDEESIRSDPQLRELLFEPIPIEEIGPYTHPWRAQE
ncbi:MAG: right-handed parallel beta-helix repeat-containing protein [Verrucomicrobiota bacterium]